MNLWDIISIILIVFGLFFIIAGVIGVLRMPDTFCRLQSATNIATMGAMPIILSASIWGFSNNNTSIAVKALIVILFLLITNPTASHAMARAAYKLKVPLTKKTKFDDYGRDIDE